MYEDKDNECDIEDNFDPEYDNEVMPPIVINEHLNNPLVKMNLKV